MTAPKMREAWFSMRWETNGSIRLHTKNRTPYLGEEHYARGNLEVLPYLEVAGEVNRRRHDIMTPHRELSLGR
jgi:hypothetical protein